VVLPAAGHDYVDGVCGICGTSGEWFTDAKGRVQYLLDGEAVKGLYKIGDDYYYFHATTGKMRTNESLFIPADNAYGLAKGSYIFGADGKMELTGFVEMNGKTYYRENGEIVKCGLYKVGENYYYFHKDTGAMRTKALFIGDNEYGIARGTYQVGADGVIIL